MICKLKLLVLQASTHAGSNNEIDTLLQDSQARGKCKVNHHLSHQLRLLLAKDLSIDINAHKWEASSHDVRNAVLVSADTLKETEEELLPQYGLLGEFSCESIELSKDLTDNTIFVNTNIPFSAFICGVQGSGKSYTTSCLLGKPN